MQISRFWTPLSFNAFGRLSVGGDLITVRYPVFPRRGSCRAPDAAAGTPLPWLHA
jgi:hypothetical protein